MTGASRRANKERSKKKKETRVAAESSTAIPSSSTEYRLAERPRIARVGGDFWKRDDGDGESRGSAVEDARLVARKVGEGRREGNLSDSRGALAFFLPSETPPAEAARASPIDFYF